MITEHARGVDYVASSGLLTTAARDGRSTLIEEIAGEWRALCEEGARNEPFYRPEWITAYLNAFDPDARLLLVTARAGSRLRAVLPLVQGSKFFCGVPTRVLESPSNVHSCRFDIVHGVPDGDVAVRALWDHLKQRGAWEVLCIKDVPAGGAAESLLALAAQDEWPVGQWETQSSPFIPLGGMTDPLALAQDGHFRANLRRRLRRATEHAPLALERTDRPTSEALERFYAIEASGWKGQEGTAIAASADTRRFYDTVAQAAARFGYLSLYTLRLGADPIAGHFGLSYNGRYYTPKVAYDERYAAFSPGHLMVEAVLHDFVGRGMSEFDFLGPSMSWKLQWTPHVRRHSDCYIFRDSPLGRALYLAKFQMMARLRPVVRRGRTALFAEDTP